MTDRPALDLHATLIHTDSGVQIHKVVVGSFDNNVYVVRCTETSEAILIDAANEHDLLFELSQALGVTRILETHGHWDHIGAVEEMRSKGYSVGVAAEDAHMLPSYDDIIASDEVIAFGRQRLRTIHTPGHTPGSLCFALDGLPFVFSGDTLFPGGPGATKFEGGDFPTIIESIDRLLFASFDADTIVLPVHGAETTIGDESPHLPEALDRCW